jgi:membrane associated rhomboid family serine protease
VGAFIDQRLPEDEAREPLLRSPAIVNAFILAFIAVHVVTHEFLDETTFGNFLLNFAMIPERVMTPEALLQGPVWIPPWATLLTYAFLHGDYMHLTFNVMWFMIFGTAVARRVGNARFLGLIFVTVLGAALTHLVFYWGSPAPVVGVSGAVSGLMGAAFRFILPNPNPGTSWPPPALPLFSRPVVTMTLVWSVLNIALGVIGLTPDGIGYPIAWEAHLGGYLTGLVLFPLFDRRRGWLR